MTIDDIIAYYQALLIQQYVNKPKARATVAAFVKVQLADLLTSQVGDGFNVDTAAGAQLDMIAEYRGVNRNLYGIDFGREYLSLAFYGDSDVAAGALYGFPFYGDADPTGYFLLYADQDRFAYSMNDDELRRIVKLRALVHSSRLSVADIDDILFSVFADKVTLTDNENMTIVYTDEGVIGNLLSLADTTGSLPRPAGVAATTA